MISGSGIPLGGRRLFYAANEMNINMQSRSIINLLKSVLLVTLLPAVCACSTESWKQTGYETLQNIRQQQCEKNLSMECVERKSYEAYRREVEDYETNQVPNPIRSRTTVESITDHCMSVSTDSVALTPHFQQQNRQEAGYINH
jgi:hypothetical protein